MTLKQAQKLYEDSVQAKMTHADNCMTQSQLEYIGRTIWGFTPDKQAKVLFTKIGKKSIYVIASKEHLLKKLVNLLSANVQYVICIIWLIESPSMLTMN